MQKQLDSLAAELTQIKATGAGIVVLPFDPGDRASWRIEVDGEMLNCDEYLSRYPDQPFMIDWPAQKPLSAWPATDDHARPNPPTSSPVT